MDFIFEDRLSDSPFVEAIWRTQSGSALSFTSQAESHWGIVVTKQYGRTTFTVRGPETQASHAPVPPDAEMFGIIFKLGTFMPHMPTIELVDHEMHIPESTRRSFRFHGSTWQFPNFDNADTFVARLVREELLSYEPIVKAALQGQLKDLSLRSVQRRFLRATGLSHRAIYQIKRAQQAMALLRQGVSILDTVELADYSDQPHLTRSLKRLMGYTPAQILGETRAE